MCKPDGGIRTQTLTYRSSGEKDGTSAILLKFLELVAEPTVLRAP